MSGHKTAVGLEHEDDFKQVLSDDDGLATMTVPWVTVQNKDIVGALDFLDVNPPACNQVEITRHVSFAETVEMVEFDPAVHAVSAPMVEYDATLMMAHQAYAAPASVVEYDAASTETHWLCAAPTAVIEYDAYAAQAVPSPLVDGPVVKVVHVPQVQVVEKM